VQTMPNGCRYIAPESEPLQNLPGFDSAEQG
jgi:hypothetical protein